MPHLKFVRCFARGIRCAVCEGAVEFRDERGGGAVLEAGLFIQEGEDVEGAAVEEVKRVKVVGEGHVAHINLLALVVVEFHLKDVEVEEEL